MATTNFYIFIAVFAFGIFTGWSGSLRYFKSNNWELKNEIKRKRLLKEAEQVDLERDKILDKRIR